MNKWDERFSRIAREVSTWSKDPRTKIGAVAVRDKLILSTGVNGLPSGMDDSNEILDNRELKNQFIVHAEANCIYNAAQNGVSLKGSTMYVYGLPVCSECAKALIQSGVSRIVMTVDKPIPVKWSDSFKKSETMFTQVGISYIINTLL